MKRYLVSSNKMTGEVILEYHEYLAKVDFSQTDLSPGNRLWFLQRIPPLADQLPGLIANTPLVIIEEDIIVNFEDWWKLYDRKINKERALKLWEKLKATEKLMAWTGLLKYNKHLQKIGWAKNKADPETFLKNKYWQNEWK